MKRCFKKGHKSRGAAEAHMRALLKIQDINPDAKEVEKLNVYYCIARRCRENPWHVGHARKAVAA